MEDEVITLPPDDGAEQETKAVDPLVERFERLLKVQEAQSEVIGKLADQAAKPVYHPQQEPLEDDDEYDDDMTPNERALANQIKELQQQLTVPVGTSVKTQVIEIIQDSGLTEYQKKEAIKQVKAANASQLAKYQPEVVANYAIVEALKIKEPEKHNSEPPAGSTSSQSISFNKPYIDYLRSLGVGKGLDDKQVAKQYASDPLMITMYENATGRKAR